MVVKGGEVSSSGGFDVCGTSDDERMVSWVLQGKWRRGAEQGWVKDFGGAAKQNTVNAGSGAACLHSLGFGAFLMVPKLSQGTTDTREEVREGVLRVWGQGVKGTEVWRGPGVADTERMERDRSGLGSIDQTAKPTILPEEETNCVIAEVGRGPRSGW